MKIIKNEKLIKRNSTIGQWLSLGALVVLDWECISLLPNLSYSPIPSSVW